MQDTAASSSNAELPSEVRRILRRSRLRSRFLASVRGLGITLGSASLLFLMALEADRFFILGNTARIAVTLAAVSLVAALAIWFLVRRLARPLSEARVARALEAVEPRLEESLISVVELSQTPPGEPRRCSPQLLESLSDFAAQRASGLDVRRLLDPRPARRGALAGCCGLALVAACALVDTSGFLQLAKRFLYPGTDLPRPTRVHLRVSPGNRVIARGEDVDVVIEVERGHLKTATLQYRHPGQAWSDVDLSPLGSASPRQDVSFHHRIERVRESIEYRIRGGDFLSPVFLLEPRDPPRPVWFRITYRAPAYTGQAPVIVESTSGDLAALKGSRADLLVRVDQDIARATAYLVERTEEGEAQGLKLGVVVTGRELAVTGIAVEADGAYRLELETESGVTNAGRDTHAIRALEDQPPGVTILEPRVAEVVVEPSSLLKLHFRAEDDYGLRAVDLVTGSSDKQGLWPLVRCAQGEQPQRLLEKTWPFSVANLGLEPGETLPFHLRVRDTLGQESVTGERTLRAAYLPQPPEGPNWLARLRGLSEGFESLERSWRNLIVETEETLGGPLEENPSPAVLTRAMKEVITLRIVAFRLAESAVTLGRSIAVPSPNREALEALGFHLDMFVHEEMAAFWRTASTAAGRRVDGDAIPEGTSDALRNLVTTHRRGAERLRSLANPFEEIRRVEHLEESYERLELLRHDALQLSSDIKRGGPAAALSRRAVHLRHGLVSLAADLTQLGGNEAATASIATLAEDILSGLVSRLEVVHESLKDVEKDEGSEAIPFSGVLEQAEREFDQQLAKLRLELTSRGKLAVRARASLEPEDSLALRIRNLARLLRSTTQEADRATAVRVEQLEETRRILALTDFLIDRTEAFEYPDFESSATLAALRDLLERALREHIAQDGVGEETSLTARDPAERAAFLEVLAQKCEATRPARVLGRAVQRLEWIAAGEEECVWKLQSSHPRNLRTLGVLARTQQSILDSLQTILARLVERTSGPRYGLARPRLQAVVKKLDVAAGEFLSSATALRSEPAGLQDARARGRRAARLSSEAAQDLEEIREQFVPEARQAQAWLQERRGSLAERVARVGARQRAHASRVGRLASPASDSLAHDRVTEELEQLALLEEEHRRQVLLLAEELRREANKAMQAKSTIPSVQACDHAAHRLDLVAREAMLQALKLLKQGAALRGKVPRPLVLSAADHGATAADEILAVADALQLIEEKQLEHLASEDFRTLLGESEKLAQGEDTDPAAIVKRARRLLDACLQAARVLGGRLPAGPLKKEILQHLGAAAAHFEACLGLADGRRAEQGPPPEARMREELVAGLARLQQAVAVALKMRGEAAERLAAERTPPADKEKGPSKEVAREVAETRRELEKLLALRARELEVQELLEKLLGEDATDAEALRKAIEAERELAKALQQQFLTTEELIELISKLVVIDREGQSIDRAERVLEEESRGHAAARRAPGSELVKEQHQLATRARTLVQDFSRAGSKLTVLLPQVYRSFRKASEQTDPLVRSMDAAAAALEGESSSEGARAIRDARLHLGVFLAGVDATRRRALEALAEAQSGASASSSGQLTLARALDSIRAASKLLAQGQVEDALRMQRSAARGLGATARGLRRRLEEIPGTSGNEGSLVSRLLEEEALRRGLVWQVETRDADLPQISVGEDENRGWREMPYPQIYSELIRVYRQAVKPEVREP